jgi:hypothetical protein
MPYPYLYPRLSSVPAAAAKPIILLQRHAICKTWPTSCARMEFWRPTEGQLDDSRPFCPGSHFGELHVGQLTLG